jgi:hypothetical protein
MILDSRLKYRRTVLLLPLSSSLDAHPYSLSNPSLYKANSPTIPAATPAPRPTCIFPAAPVFSGGAPPDALGVIGLDPLGVGRNLLVQEAFDPISSIVIESLDTRGKVGVPRGYRAVDGELVDGSDYWGN